MPRALRRRPGVLAALAAVVLVAAGPPAPAAAATAPAPAAGLAAAPPATPLLSVRRVPTWVQGTVAAQRLAASLPPILASLGAAQATSCLVVEAGGRTVLDRHGTEELLPASNMKLLSGTAVLEDLGAASRLRTRVAATAAPVDGVVHGDLYLIGDGDPLLWTPGYQPAPEPALVTPTSLAALAARVRAAGITRVTGAVVGDESRFDSVRTAPGWKADYTEEGDVGPLSALDVDNGFPTTAADAALAPAAAAAAAFSALLRDDGVDVGGPPTSGVAPAAAAAVTSIESAPLGQVVGAVLRVSDDTGAELLVKQLGARLAGTGSTAAGVALVRRRLAADGLPVGQLREVDGSGLSLLDRASCGLVAADLRHVGTGGPVFAGLPVAGRTGTLVDRMVATPAAGRLHAKTGTLDDVAALSGFVLPAPGAAARSGLAAPIVFSFIANGLPFTTGEAVADRVGVALAAYPDVPPLADAVPERSAGGR